MIRFTAYIKPEPQGSAKAFVRNGRANITSDNTKLRPYRSEVTRSALAELADKNLEHPMCAKGVPVELDMLFSFRRPDSAPKKRKWPVVKPDLDKLARATKDALTGVAYQDDSQVVIMTCKKVYGDIEYVRVTAREYELDF